MKPLLFVKHIILVFSMLLIISSCGGGNTGEDESNQGNGQNSGQDNGPDSTPDTTPTPSPDSVPDIKPNSFAFVPASGVEPDVFVESNSVTIRGIDSSAVIQIQNGEYAIGDSAFTAQQGSVNFGDTIKVRVKSSQQFNTSITSAIQVGEFNTEFTVTTRQNNQQGGGTTLDTTPTAFFFVASSSAAQNSVLESNSIVVKGINSETTIQVAGGEYAIDNGTFTDSTGTVVEGQTIKVRLTTPSQPLTSGRVTLNIGGVTGHFDVTTRSDPNGGNDDEDTNPNAFFFTAKTNVPRSTEVLSNTITVRGITRPAEISIAGGSYAINGTAFTNTPGEVSDGDTVTVKLLSPANFNTTNRAVLIVGNFSANFDVKTIATGGTENTEEDNIPNAFFFVPKANTPPGSEVFSNTVTIRGINVPTEIGITNGEYSINGSAFTNTPSLIENGQTIMLRTLAAELFSTVKTVTLSIGSISADFTVTSAATSGTGEGSNNDSSPNPFFFVEQTNLDLETLVESNSTTVNGINTPTPVTIEGGEFSINNGEYSSINSTISAGQSIRVRTVTPATLNTPKTVLLTVGEYTAEFQVTTRTSTGGGNSGNDSTPNAFFFVNQTSVEPSSILISNAIIVRGINIATAIRVSGGEYSINDGDFTNQPSTVNNGDSVKLRLQASADFDTNTVALLTIGDVSDDFTVTTSSEDASSGNLDTTPNSFFFVDALDVELTTPILSNTISVRGFNAVTSISIVDGEYSISNSEYTSEDGELLPGQSVRLRLISSSEFNDTKTATLTIGGVVADFKVTTFVKDTSPENFSFDAVENVQLNSENISDEIEIKGVNAPTPISIIGGEYSINGGEFTNEVGVITNHQIVRVKLIAGTNPAETTTATLTVGNLARSFNVKTGSDDEPDGFSFFPIIDAPVSDWVRSDIFTVRGIDVGSPISISGGEYSINSNTFTNEPGLVFAGQTVSIRLLTSDAETEQHQATLTIGGVSAKFTVTTGTLPISVSCLQMDFVPVKAFAFSCPSSDETLLYHLKESHDGTSELTRVLEGLFIDFPETPHVVPLYARMNAKYALETCNGVGCVTSNTISVQGNPVDSIGYFKSSNANAGDLFGIPTLNGNGKILVVGSPAESSNQSGVFNGAISDPSNANALNNNAAPAAGAAYVFTFGVFDWTQSAYLKASNVSAGDHFGQAVAISADGKTIAIGAPLEDSGFAGVNTGNPDNSEEIENSGAVYIFVSETIPVPSEEDENEDEDEVDEEDEESITVWKFQAQIKASNPSSFNEFGSTLSLSENGNTLSVGVPLERGTSQGVDPSQNQAPNSDPQQTSGAVYIFQRNNGIWNQQAYIKAHNANNNLNQHFGTDVSLSATGDVLAVGASNEESGHSGIRHSNEGGNTEAPKPNSGAAYIFVRSGSTWEQRAFIKSEFPDEGDAFGQSIAISSDGKSLAIGAPFEDSSATGINNTSNNNSRENSGAVFLFSSDTGIWLQTHTVKATQSQADLNFGDDLALSANGNLLIVGASGENTQSSGINDRRNNSSAPESGAAYSFEKIDGAWESQAYIKASNTESGDRFGEIISLSGDGNTLAVGVKNEDSNGKGINTNQNNNQAEDSGTVYLY
ncbi:hypothetical protein TDB9533_04623 [Thalassocella blandensis]|nr:hypothetical protein TDB9533_04623 [Thalassocella blandensis]